MAKADHVAMPLASWISIAEAAADAAGEVLRHAFRNNLTVEAKSDGSPVTAADRDAEAVMRSIIARACPDHGIRGEELEETNAGNETVWVLDPIDGTRSFITGKPVFTSLVSLVHRGEFIIGLIDQPVTADRWVGAEGKTTTWNGLRTKVRPCARLDEAAMYTTGTEWYGTEELGAFERLRQEVLMTLYSTDAYAFGLLASGHIDLAIECQLEPHDFAALIPVVEGAGGIITDWQGNALKPDSPANVLAAGDPKVHKAAIEVLAGEP